MQSNEELYKLIENQSKEISYLKSLVVELVKTSPHIENKKKNKLLKKNDEYIDIHKLSELTGYKVNTLYKKISLLTLNKHYFKPNGGKLIFDRSAIDYIIKSTSVPKNSIDISTKDTNETKKPLTVNEFMKKFQTQKEL